MAKVNRLNSCPGCGKPLPDPIPPICPSCREVLVKPENLSFMTPNYLWSQYGVASEVIEKTKSTTRDEEGETVSNTPALQAKLKDDLLLWLKTCSDNDRLASAEDTFLHAQNIMYAGMPADRREKFIKLCKSIGRLAESAEHFFAHGGYVNVRNNPAPKGDGPMG